MNKKATYKNFNILLLNKKFNHNRITFVGLGNMGYPMAQNLLKSGFKVAGFDYNQDTTAKFKSIGGCNYDNFQTAIKSSDCLITMLPNATAVQTVWKDAFNFAEKSCILIDSSTISPIDAGNLAKESIQKGFTVGDAPVSGGVMGATMASLSFMVGSKKEDFEKIKFYLTPMGKKFFYCGDNSSGQIAKICNNLCLGITMAGLSESLALGVKLGIDPKMLSEIISTSSGRCWSSDTYNPIPDVMQNVPSSRNYENGFSTELMTKDLNIALDCAEKTNLNLDLSQKTQEYYNIIKKMGYNSKDFSFVYQYIFNNKKI